jgi:hypothetical protein
VLSLNDYFKGLLVNLNPPDDRLELARTLPATVRNHIVRSDRVETVEDGPITHLAGSYARHTTTDDIKDVDILIFVDPDYENHEPKVVLDSTADALRDLEVDGYGKGEIRLRHKQRRSVHVSFKDGDSGESFHIDVVPVIRHGEKTGVLRIPDREWTRWDDTQPIGYAEALNVIHERYDDNVRPMIRMVKRIRNVHLGGMKRPKSFWLEAAVFNVFRSGRLRNEGTTAERIIAVLEALRADCGLLPMRITDPCLGRNLTDSWDQAEYEKFVAALDKVLGFIHEIENEADADKAIAAWRKVFGDAFALTAEDQANADRAKALGVASKVTGTGLVIPATDPRPGTVTRPHTYYGDRA